LFVIIVTCAYFIDISPGSVETHLRRGAIYNNYIITNCLTIIGEDMDKSKVAHFLAHPVEKLLVVH